MKYTAKLGAEYKSLWDGMAVSAAKQAEARSRAKIIYASKARYEAMEGRTGVPWHFIGLVHYRECNNNFKGVLHNGELIVGTNRKTTLVPKGRGPFKTWEDAAYDALVNVQGYRKGMDWSLGQYAFRIEGYNGYGYHSKGIPSPYLWGGSSKQKRGKYIKDGVYDGNTWDTQLGVLTILRSLLDLDGDIQFGGETIPPLPPVQVPPPDIEPPLSEATQPPPSPNTDGGATVKSSKTIWATAGGILTTIFGAVGSVVMDWKALAVFCAFIIIALFLFVGRERIRKIFDQGL